jgi:DNA (cytosine-5)-methyltransferase 1
MRGVVERSETCVATLNLNRKLFGLQDPVQSLDVDEVNWSGYEGKLDLLAGGVPCQPFSFGGRARGQRDHRNAFPEFIAAISQSRPRAVLVENVKGFASETFLNYFDYVLLQIEMPSLVRKSGETWRTHLARLKLARKTYVRAGELAYRVAASVLQAADYGVPQQRERLFIVGFRSDLDRTWTAPAPTHGVGALLRSLASGAYAERHEIRALATERLKSEAPTDDAAGLKPWRTPRDAFVGLEEPSTRDDGQLRHFVRPGARAYSGHWGSPIDFPAKTIKAGVHGVPGGENMARFSNGRVRYFTLREAARLQTFPDRFRIAGSWTAAYRQLGNAVPVLLSSVVGRSVMDGLALSKQRRGTRTGRLAG